MWENSYTNYNNLIERCLIERSLRAFDNTDSKNQQTGLAAFCLKQKITIRNQL